MVVATTEPVRLPPMLRLPKLIQGIGFGPFKHQMFERSVQPMGHPVRHQSAPPGPDGAS